MPCKVSVITPSYNQGAFIERTIISVLAQKFAGTLEYIVMDGGSQDGTLETLKRYGSPVRWVSERDHGQAHAVNKGLDQATGDFIGWLNSDDIYYPGAIATACDVLESRPDIDIVYGDANHIGEDDSVLGSYPTEAWNWERLLETCFICQPAVFFRKSVVNRFGPLNEDLNFCLDYEYWIRLANSGARFYWVPRLMAGSRLHLNTKTLGSRIQCHAEINDMLRGHFGQVPDGWLFNYAHAVLDQRGVLRSASFRFPLLVSMISIYASIRWNRGVSSKVWRTTQAWTGGAMLSLFRETK